MCESHRPAVWSGSSPREASLTGKVHAEDFFPQGGVSLRGSGWSGTYYAQQVDLTLTELHLRSLLPECRMQRHSTPHLARMKKCDVVVLLKANLDWSWTHIPEALSELRYKTHVVQFFHPTRKIWIFLPPENVWRNVVYTVSISKCRDFSGLNLKNVVYICNGFSHKGK